MLLDRLGENAHHLIGCRIVVARPAAGQMGHLDDDVRSERKQLLEKHPSLRSPLGPLFRERRPEVDDDGHVVLVCLLEDSLEPFDVHRIIQLDVRVREVQLDATTETGVFRATLELGERILPEGIEAAKGVKPFRVLGSLSRRNRDTMRV